MLDSTEGSGKVMNFWKLIANKESEFSLFDVGNVESLKQAV